MSVMKEFRQMSSEQLEERMREFKKELLKLNVEVAAGSGSTNPGKLKQTKKNIARILMLLQEKKGADK